MPKGNIIELFRTTETLDSVNNVLQDAVAEAKKSPVINCMIVMIDDNDAIAYSYANYYRKASMVGALERLKFMYMENDEDS